MLRPGLSLLASALGRVVEPPLTPTPPAPFPPQALAAHALHARLLSWFLDAPAAPFGVHRMALAGKAAGKDVGMWFGPNAAAGALRTLVDAFPICGLGVSFATDGTFYQTDVFAASHSPAISSSSNPSSSHGHGSVSSHGHGRGSTSSSAYSHGSRRKEKDGKEETKRWGDRPVLLLLGIKLGIEGVNPVYYETIKLLYTFPQSVGIAGGRPSSSYYFVGAQGDGLFYLDPHHSHPSVPLHPFLGEPIISAHGRPSSRSLSPEAYARGGSMTPDFGLSLSQGQGAGQSPMTEDELVIRPTSRRRGPLRTMTTIWGWRASRTPKRLRTPGLTTTTAMATPTSRVLRTPHTTRPPAPAAARAARRRTRRRTPSPHHTPPRRALRPQRR
ncbi:hypothetical protein B0H16DRAFT_1608276, partial [Mycena metata]